MARSEKPKLTPIKHQFSLTWRLFAAGWWKFLLIVGLPLYVVSFGSMLLSSRMGAAPTNPMLTLGLGYLLATIILAYIVVYFIAQAGFIHSLDKVDRVSVKEAYRRGVDYALSLFWVMFLTGLLVGLGLLVVVPGIIFLIWYTFAPFALIHKEQKGMAALRESRELVCGYWWPVFGRLILFYVIIVTVQIQAGIMLPALDPSLVSVIIQPLVNIFITIYAFVIFRNLEEIKHPETSSPSGTPNRSSPSPPAGS